METRASVTGRVTDLAAGGCYVDTINPFVEGTEVSVRLVHEGRQFQCRACVIYARSGMGMGLAFTGGTPEQAAVLNDWLRELRGQVPPDFRQCLEPQEAAAKGSETDSTQFSNLRVVVLELLRLLVNKRLLNESEADALHSKLSR